MGYWMPEGPKEMVYMVGGWKCRKGIRCSSAACSWATDRWAWACMCGAHVSGTPLQGTQLQRISFPRRHPSPCAPCTACRPSPCAPCIACITISVQMLIQITNKVNHNEMVLIITNNVFRNTNKPKKHNYFKLHNPSATQSRNWFITALSLSFVPIP